LKVGKWVGYRCSGIRRAKKMAPRKWEWILTVSLCTSICANPNQPSVCEIPSE
jgi:hypothetical protein